MTYGIDEGWAAARFDPNAPRPEGPYERCALDGTWTRAEVERNGRRFPVCWPCHRAYGALLGPALDAFVKRLAEGVSRAVLEERAP